MAFYQFYPPQHANFHDESSQTFRINGGGGSDGGDSCSGGGSDGGDSCSRSGSLSSFFLCAYTLITGWL